MSHGGLLVGVGVTLGALYTCQPEENPQLRLQPLFWLGCPARSRGVSDPRSCGIACSGHDSALIDTLCAQEHVSTCAAQAGKRLKHFETWQQQNPSLSQSSAGLSVPWPLHRPCSAHAGWESGLGQPLVCSTMSREESWGHRNNWSCAGAQPQHHVAIKISQAGGVF